MFTLRCRGGLQKEVSYCRDRDPELRDRSELRIEMCELCWTPETEGEGGREMVKVSLKGMGGNGSSPTQEGGLGV